jgi:RNA recognition motif-containing protein
METQRDTIFIQNLPRSVTTDELRDVFSQIGMIKVRYYSFNSFNKF